MASACRSGRFVGIPLASGQVTKAPALPCKMQAMWDEPDLDEADHLPYGHAMLTMTIALSTLYYPLP